MKKLVFLLFAFFLLKDSQSQTGLSLLIKSDSTLNYIRKEVINIYKEYNVNDHNYQRKLPDSLVKKVDILFLLYTQQEHKIKSSYFFEKSVIFSSPIYDEVLLSDTFYKQAIELKGELISIYGDLTSSYPQPMNNIYSNLQQLLDRRKLLLEQQSNVIWNKTEDSLIESKVFVFEGIPKFGFGLSSNQGFISAQYAFVLGLYKNAYFGLGSGIEYVNRGSGLVNLFQAPVYVTNYFYLGRMAYLNFDYGLCIPMSASFKNNKDVMVDYKDSDLKNTFYIDLGIGIQKFKTGFQFNFRNQSLGIPDDLNQRVWMFGFKIKF